MEIPDTIKRLVDVFERNIDTFKTGNINETQLRREYLDPFFTALGWDVENKQGYAEAYKDVIHEYSLKTKDVREAPDYCFRIGGTRKFFVEAKKPSVNVKEDIHPAYQLRSYAWSAKLPLSILTDFEEFAVYDCRILPNKRDKASIARIMFFTYDEYISRWNEIEEIFSRESILKGSFDKYVESNKKKKGTAEVDEVFLDQMEEWRKSLAKNIALRNSTLHIRELNYAVQKIIDRLIFLRICEDRGIEDYGQLMSLQNGANVYERLKQIYHRADEKYNSGLFHFEYEKERNEPPDEITLDLVIDDKTIKDIIKELYYPDSPYEFSVLPADILGQVYEQFLGKVIRLTSGHHAVIDDKPEVKKAGGVYYTPTYIVDYIVKSTLGKSLTQPSPKERALGKGLSPNEVSKLKILDPACGSGSFLLGAYQCLLDWHLKYYTSSEESIKRFSQAKRQPIYQNDRGDYLLTTSEKKRILLNNIYGVDIDPQAVEVTKLSLLLKVLEGESSQTLSNELKFFRERALPDLSNNIKCGNSLIGPDFYDQLEMQFLSDEEKLRINVFDWKKEFPNVFRHSDPALAGEESQGFDVVIGNPPYLGGREWKEENGNQYEYFIKYFEIAEYQFDIYSLFLEKSVLLARQNGMIGFITPNTWLNNQSNLKLRKFILTKTIIDTIVDYSRIKVFKDAVVLPIVTILEKTEDKKRKSFFYEPKDNLLKLKNSINQKVFIKDALHIINIDLNEDDIRIREKIEMDSETLESLATVKFGIKLYETGKGIPVQKAEFAKNHVYESNHKEDITYRKFLEGKDIQRYEIIWVDKWLKYGKNLAAPRDPELFTGQRILVRRIVGETLICAFTDKDYVTSQLLQIVKPKDESFAHYILAILNSRLMAYYFRKKYNRQDKTFPEIRIYELCTLPIKITSDKKLKDHIEDKAKSFIGAKERFNSVKIPNERAALERQIEATDKQIDQLVYQLYGLTEEEIRIVERI